LTLVGVGGDAGAWVFDNRGRVCGMVLAWHQQTSIAYIQPMQVILEDIKRTLGATEVCLPDPRKIYEPVDNMRLSPLPGHDSYRRTSRSSEASHRDTPERTYLQAASGSDAISTPSHIDPALLQLSHDYHDLQVD
jgi:hypothetical protein